MTGRIDDLERLAKLHQDGVLTDAEFAQEKARLLGGDEPRSSEPARASEAMPEVAATASKAVAPDDNDLLAPIRPIPDAAYAAFLIRKAWAGVASLIAANALSAIPEIRESLSPSLGLMAPEPLPTAVVVAGALLGCLIVGLVGYWLSRRRSRIAAILLFIMAASVVMFGAGLPWNQGIWVNLAIIALGLFSIWFFVGAWRGLTFISRAPKGEAEAAMVLQTTNAAPVSKRMKAAWNEGREQSRPVRRAIWWIGLAGLTVFAAGGVWFWTTISKDEPPAASPPFDSHAQQPDPTVTAPSSTHQFESAPVSPASLRPADLEGSWLPEYEACRHCFGMSFERGGVYAAEGVDGTWTLDGNKLTVRSQYTSMDGDVGPWVTDSAEVQLISKDMIEITWAYDEPMRYGRYIADGSSASGG